MPIHTTTSCASIEPVYVLGMLTRSDMLNKIPLNILSGMNHSIKDLTHSLFKLCTFALPYKQRFVKIK